MTETRQPWWLWPLLVVLLPLVVVGGVLWLMAAVLLQLVVWLTWCSRGRYVLVVYSYSPIWQEYFEQNVLPAVGSRGVVLNWSDRKQWSYSLPVALFRFFAGTREFNPLAIVFQPLAWPRRFRFYAPFKAFKHGRRPAHGGTTFQRRALRNPSKADLLSVSVPSSALFRMSDAFCRIVDARLEFRAPPASPCRNGTGRRSP
jgi:hypothetical protein